MTIPRCYKVDPPDCERVMKLGYYMREFTPYHFRFQDRFDFWPKRARWIDIKAGARGRGVESLIAHMKAETPVEGP